MTVEIEKLKALAPATPEHEFTDDERRLYELMSEISEDCWCAGWMHGNEFSLWEAISTGNLKYGMGEMDRDLLAQVAALSTKIGKWVIWRDDQDGLDPHDVSEWGPYAITLKDWTDGLAEAERLRAEKEAPDLPVIPPTRGTGSQRDADLRDVIAFALGLAEKEDAWSGMGFLAAWNDNSDDFLRAAWPEFAELEAATRCRAEGGGTNSGFLQKFASERYGKPVASGTAPAAGTDKDAELSVVRIAINLVELSEESERNQACVHGSLVGGHAVYCHNTTWPDAPRKCRRTWYTGGEVRDEDCGGFKARVLALPSASLPATPCRDVAGAHTKVREDAA